MDASPIDGHLANGVHAAPAGPAVPAAGASGAGGGNGLLIGILIARRVRGALSPFGQSPNRPLAFPQQLTHGAGGDERPERHVHVIVPCTPRRLRSLVAIVPIAAGIAAGCADGSASAPTRSDKSIQIQAPTCEDAPEVLAYMSDVERSLGDVRSKHRQLRSLAYADIAETSTPAFVDSLDASLAKSERKFDTIAVPSTLVSSHDRVAAALKELTQMRRGDDGGRDGERLHGLLAHIATYPERIAASAEGLSCDTLEGKTLQYVNRMIDAQASLERLGSDVEAIDANLVLAAKADAAALLREIPPPVTATKHPECVEAVEGIEIDNLMSENDMRVVVVEALATCNRVVAATLRASSRPEPPRPASARP